MRVLLYADFRSPHATEWLRALTDYGLDVHPVASEAGSQIQAGEEDLVTSARAKFVRLKATDSAGGRIVKRLTNTQSIHSALDISRRRRRQGSLKQAVAGIRPDLVHALRLPYEGVTAATAGLGVPVAVSAWGLDFVPQAQRDPLLRLALRRALPRVQGFHADATADFLRARGYGLRKDIPLLHAPGNAGVDTSLFHPENAGGRPLVLCGRSPAPNVAAEAFLDACVSLTGRIDVDFAAVGRERFAEIKPEWRELESAGRLTIYPRLDRQRYAALVRQSAVVVSPGLWDGTPNTVLEAVAARVPVVAGRIPALSDLPGVRSHVVEVQDPTDRTALAEAICQQLDGAERSPFTPEPFLDRERNASLITDFYQKICV